MDPLPNIDEDDVVVEIEMLEGEEVPNEGLLARLAREAAAKAGLSDREPCGDMECPYSHKTGTRICWRYSPTGCKRARVGWALEQRDNQYGPSSQYQGAPVVLMEDLYAAGHRIVALTGGVPVWDPPLGPSLEDRAARHLQAIIITYTGHSQDHRWAMGVCPVCHMVSTAKIDTDANGEDKPADKPCRATPWCPGRLRIAPSPRKLIGATIRRSVRTVWKKAS